MRFEFATATRILFGAGVLRQVGPIARDLGNSALVVTGQNPERAKPLTHILAQHSVGSHLFTTCGEPNLTTVEAGLARARETGSKIVISFGGGSAIDAGKAIAAMLTNGGHLLDYLEVIGGGQTLVHPSAPFIAIPTTAGTGSEVTRNSVLASPEHRVKVSLRSPLMLPRVALVDPELTYDLPPAITATTGLDALTQLIEPYVSARSNPLIDALCVEGITRVARALPRAFATGGDIAARCDLAMGSLFGGLALANAGLGAVHGFAGPIGGMFPAPHGAVCAALLPHVMEANVRALKEREPNHPALLKYAELARIFTAGPKADSQTAIAWVRQLVSDLNIPPLRAYGVGREQFEELVKNAARASSMKANPIVLTPAELATVLEQAT
jgi:alcohol dehydrogenase class IV